MTAPVSHPVSYSNTNCGKGESSNLRSRKSRSSEWKHLNVSPLNIVWAPCCWTFCNEIFYNKHVCTQKDSLCVVCRETFRHSSPLSPDWDHIRIPGFSVCTGCVFLKERVATLKWGIRSDKGEQHFIQLCKWKIKSILPVIYANFECPNIASMHVVPECEAVARKVRLQYITNQDSWVVPMTHWGVHIQIVTWRKCEIRMTVTVDLLLLVQHKWHISNQSDASDVALRCKLSMAYLAFYL